jgi:hypothetical protein
MRNQKRNATTKGSADDARDNDNDNKKAASLRPRFMVLTEMMTVFYIPMQNGSAVGTNGAARGIARFTIRTNQNCLLSKF